MYHIIIHYFRGFVKKNESPALCRQISLENRHILLTGVDFYIILNSLRKR